MGNSIDNNKSAGTLDLGMTSMHNEEILEGIIRGMSDGVIIIGLDGRVKYTNPAALTILDKEPAELQGRILASVFYEYSENDHFNQTILNAVLDPEKKQYDVVPFFTGEQFRQLHVMTSILWLNDERIGIIMIINDITELASLKIRYSQQITNLLDSLVKALSTAIDERSRYTGKHTRNMVKMGRTFLDWLEMTDSSLKFDHERKRAFLMSIWLHDVGKLTIPLEIMDKATRLGDRLDLIEQRLNKMHLLDRIALLEGRIDDEMFKEREDQRDEWILAIHRINHAGYLKDDDFAYIRKMAEFCYEDEDGRVHPFLTDEEVLCLQIRKGTLTNEERATMQGHVIMTRKILDSVEFPDAFNSVPTWASMHHEFINGTGYPDHKKGEEIPDEVRLLTILDIFEALIAKDRPYKDPFPPEKALQILHNMASEGCLDSDILALFEQSRAWECLG